MVQKLSTVLCCSGVSLSIFKIISASFLLCNYRMFPSLFTLAIRAAVREVNPLFVLKHWSTTQNNRSIAHCNSMRSVPDSQASGCCPDTHSTGTHASFYVGDLYIAYNFLHSVVVGWPWQIVYNVPQIVLCNFIVCVRRSPSDASRVWILIYYRTCSVSSIETVLETWNSFRDRVERTTLIMRNGTQAFDHSLW